MTQLKLNRTDQPIPSKLLAAVKPQDQTRFKQDYSEANFVLEVIKEAIIKEIILLQGKEESELIFKEPGYSEHYAHMMGQRQMARKLLNLFPKKG